MNIIKIISPGFCLWVLSGIALANTADSVADRYISLALQGDLSQAESLFDDMGPATAAGSVVALAERFRARFIEQSEDLSPGTGDELVDAVIAAYRKYWILTLTAQMSKQEGEDFFEASLREVLSRHGKMESSSQPTSVFKRVGEALDVKGIRYLDTPAPPLRDLFIWKTEENRNYSVRLTDRTQKVRVTFISEIYSMGWKHYATLGLTSTTGWVEGDRLYCVEWAYDRNSENFEVSYLKHESRHLADFERFPKLQSAELEYRAKLTELAFAATSTRRLLDDFSSKSALNPASPHAYANYRVTRDVYQEIFNAPFPVSGSPWQDIRTNSVNAAARNLLQRNTEILQGLQ